MKIEENISLKPYNTFGFDVKAKYFVEVNTINELKHVVQTHKKNDLFILGGGSNMLLTKDISQTVVKLNIRGIEITKETDDFVWVEVQAGEVWHQFVLWAIENGYGGIENLSLIPGNVGTTPIQNIGAYGVEIKDVMVNCKALSLTTGNIQTFSNQECQFGYRESIFKNKLKNQFIIVSVTFQLTKRNHNLKVSYGAIQNTLEQSHITCPTIKDIGNAVIAIRESKLPNPAEIGNSGSFFKNPVVDKKVFDKLYQIYPDIPFYAVSDALVKLPAGWLIEKSGFKGYRIGDAGVHNQQALVLVNYGKANGNQVKKLAEIIQREVKKIFDIAIEAEVNIF